MTIINEVIVSLFVGFGVFILATSFVRFRNEKQNKLIAGLTDSAIIIIRLATIFYLAIWSADLYASFQSGQDHDSITNRLTGPYWFGYWIYPICYGLIPQVLWVNALKKMKGVRVIAAFLLLFALYIERIVI